MANQIEKGYTFVTGELVTATKLNNHVSDAVLTKNAITEQVWGSAIPENSGAGENYPWPTNINFSSQILIAPPDGTSTELQRVPLSHIFLSGTTAAFGDVNVGDDLHCEKSDNIWGTMSANLNAGTGLHIGPLVNSTMDWKPFIIGQSEADGIRCYRPVSLDGPYAMKLHTGPTQDRPLVMSPEAGYGYTRFNTDSNSIECYGEGGWASYRAKTAIIWFQPAFGDSNNMYYEAKNVWTPLTLNHIEQSDNFVINANVLGQTIEGQQTSADVKIPKGTYVIETSACCCYNGNVYANPLKDRFAIGISVNGVTVAVSEFSAPDDWVVTKVSVSKLISLNDSDVNVVKIQYYWMTEYPPLERLYYTTYYGGQIMPTMNVGQSRLFQTKITQVK